MKNFDNKIKKIIFDDRFVAIVFFLISLQYGFKSTKMTVVLEADVVGPGFFPKLISLLGIILSIALFIGAHFTKNKTEKTFKEKIPEIDKKGFQGIAIFFLLFAYVLSFEWVGFPVDTFLFLMLSFKILGYSQWSRSCAYAAIISLTIFILFKVILDVRLPVGSLFSAFY